MIKYLIAVCFSAFATYAYADSTVCFSLLDGAGKVVKTNLTNGQDLVLPSDAKFCTIRTDIGDYVSTHKVIIKDDKEKVLMDSGLLILMIFGTESAEYLLYGPSYDYIYQASLKDPAVVRLKCVEAEDGSTSYSLFLGTHDFLLGSAEFED